jgi:hypothetical protein
MQPQCTNGSPQAHETEPFAIGKYNLRGGIGPLEPFFPNLSGYGLETASLSSECYNFSGKVAAGAAFFELDSVRITSCGFCDNTP